MADSWDDDTTAVGSEEATAKPITRAHACLTRITGTSAGQTFTVAVGTSVIGRAPDVEIRIPDEGVSRRHAQIQRDSLRVVLDDLDSRNGTYVNGHRLGAPTWLEEGDKVQIGHTVVLRFAYHDELDENFHETLLSSALRDPMTKLFNKRYLLDRLDSELKFARRHETAVSLLMLDVDHFKALNDASGHLAGDAVLVGLSSVLQKGVRNEDVVARFGGEEFCVILRAIGLEQAMALGERLRRLVEQLVTPHQDRELRATVSIGVASFPSLPAGTVEQLMEAADQALYRAKRGGRNRVAR